MDPQKNPLPPEPGNDPENPNPASPAPGVSAVELSEEAAHTPASVTPVAGQKIEPGAPAPADAASGDAADASDAQPQNQPAEPAFPAGAPAGPLPTGQPKRRKKGLFIGLIVAAVILLLSGGAAAAYFGYYVPNKPENVLKKALANSLDLQKNKTMHFSGEMVVGSEEEDFTIKTTFDGQMDHTSGSFLVSSATDALVTNITTEARSVDGKTLYFKAGGLDGLSDLLIASGLEGAETFAPAINSLNSQWIEVNEGLIKQFAGDSYQGMKISDSDARKLATAYDQNQFIVVKEALPDQDIKGVRSYHYRVAYDMPKLKSFLRAVKDANLDLIKLTDEQLEQLNQAWDQIGPMDPWDIWIGKSDKMVRQMAFDMAAEGVTVALSFTVESYNQPVTVEKPEDAMSLLELMGMFFGSVDPMSLEAELETFIEEQPSTGISL